METLQETIIAKQKILYQVREQLKREFIGIDNIIDQIINLVSSWFLFQLKKPPALQVVMFLRLCLSLSL